MTETVVVNIHHSRCDVLIDRTTEANESRCPICDKLLDYTEVDIGVGIQTGNYRCDCCGWYPERDDEDYCSFATGMEAQ